jgi:hypothetical protein
LEWNWTMIPKGAVLSKRFTLCDIYAGF